MVSVFAICHGRGVDTYRRLYQKVHRWLKPAGAFIVYDHVLGANERLTGLNAAGWRSFMDLTNAKAWADDIILTTYQEDTPLPLAQHLDLLSTAGFGTSDVLYKRDVFAIYTGIKA